MSTDIRSNKLYPSGIVMNRWTKPIEAFVPNLNYAEPIMYSTIDEIDVSQSKMQRSTDSAVLVHETSIENAENIFQNGFREGSDGMSPIRTGAVFGWIFEGDIGKHKEYSDPECDAVVFFEAPKSEVYVSSYTSSAYLLAMGMIDEDQYERDYVMNYEDFLKTIKYKPSILSHLDYNVQSVIQQE